MVLPNVNGIITRLSTEQVSCVLSPFPPFLTDNCRQKQRQFSAGAVVLLLASVMGWAIIRFVALLCVLYASHRVWLWHLKVRKQQRSLPTHPWRTHPGGCVASVAGPQKRQSSQGGTREMTQCSRVGQGEPTTWARGTDAEPRPRSCCRCCLGAA